MTSDKTSFICTSQNKGSKFDTITVGNGSTLNIAAKGDIEINDKIILSNVLLVPDLCANLLSVSQALDTGNIESAVFTRTTCRFLSSDDDIIAEGYRHNGGLWQISTEFDENSVIAFNASEEKSLRTLQQWHEHLAYVNYHTIIDMVRKNILRTSSNVDSEIPTCNACIQGKMSRPPFKSSTSPPAPDSGHTTHADLIGPLETKSQQGYRYILTLVDDHSRFTTAFPIHHKSDAKFRILHYLKNLIERGLQPRILRSDNGTEFFNSTLRRFMIKNGMQQQSSTRYSPQQNGVAERANRTLIEGARTLLIAHQMPKRLWPDALHIAVTSRNRVPHRKTGEIPHSLFLMTPLIYDDFPSFGQPCFVHIPDEKRKKLDAKAEEMRYLGPANGQKGARFFDNHGRIIISRDYKIIHSKIQENYFSPVIAIDSINTNEEPTQSTPTTSEQDQTARILPHRERKGPVRFANQHFSYSAVTSEFPTSLLDPATYDDALSSPHASNWQYAMDAEYQSLIDNGTWELRSLPKVKKAIGAKWVYKTKTDRDGNLTRFKARYVAKGFKQIQGIDFEIRSLLL